MQSNIIIGRQPILDLHSTLIGYELLFRSATENIADITDDRYATAKVVTDALNAVGLDDLIGNKTAFINVDKTFLINPVIEAIPADRFIFEILETVEIDNEVIERMAHLHKLGYTFALDDYDFSIEQLSNIKNVLPYVHIVKIDLTTCSDIKNSKEKMDFLKTYNIDLLAEKVETHQEYQACLDLGFTYFQGYYFAKPDIIEGKKLSASKLTIISIIKHIIAEEEDEVIEKEISHSPEVSVSLLKYLNSASFGIKREIGSIKQAIMLLGVKPLLRWITLLLYAVPDEDDKFAKPLMETVLLRAELMKQLTLKISSKEEADKAYFIGLISMLDTILHQYIEVILKEMSFDDQINDAILHNESLLAKTLQLSKSIQETQDKSTMCDNNKTDISCNDMAEILTTSYINVMKLTQEL
jgi:c-di-GMP phosphodiesterase